MKFALIACAAGALVALRADVAATQAPERPVRQWSVSLSLGGMFGKSTDGVERAMRDGGFDDPSA